MWDVCTITSTTGQRKNKQDHACKLKAMDGKNVTKLDYTSRFVKQCFSRARRDGEPRPRRGGTQNTASQRRNTKRHSKGKGWLKTSRNIDSQYHETLKTFPRIRELMESSQPENKRCWASRDFPAARCDNKQPNVHGWAESPKQHVSR